MNIWVRSPYIYIYLFTYHTLATIFQFPSSCSTHRIYLVPALMAFQVSMNSTLDIRLQNAVQSTLENGYLNFCENYALMLIHQLTKVHQQNASLLNISRSPSFTTYKTAQILPFYVSFNIGLGIAFLVFLGELAYHKYERRCRMTLRRFLSKYRNRYLP